MTFMEWITRVKKYRVMEYMRLSYKERVNLREEYYSWYVKQYNKPPVIVTI